MDESFLVQFFGSATEPPNEQVLFGFIPSAAGVFNAVAITSRASMHPDNGSSRILRKN